MKKVFLILIIFNLILIVNDVNANKKDYEDLIIFVFNGDIEKAKKLLSSKKIDIDFVDPTFDMTPLMIASYQDNREMVSLLLEFKADANIKNSKGHTALTIPKKNRTEHLSFSNKDYTQYTEPLLNENDIENNEIIDESKVRCKCCDCVIL